MKHSQQLPTGPQFFIKKLRSSPFVCAIYLTGSYAEGRATQKSDIDLFIQVKEGRLYTARFIATLWTHLVGQRRTNTDIAGKLCLNWFATYYAPGEVGRTAILLEKRTDSTFIDRMLEGKVGQWLENWLKQYQVRRFNRDHRTYMEGSLVRWSDRELGFHPPKKSMR